MNKILKGLEAETKQIYDHIHELCWYMRGGITRDQAWHMSAEERKSVMRLVDQNIERVNKTKLPLL